MALFHLIFICVHCFFLMFAIISIAVCFVFLLLLPFLPRWARVYLDGHTTPTMQLSTQLSTTTSRRGSRWHMTREERAAADQWVAEEATLEETLKEAQADLLTNEVRETTNTISHHTLNVTTFLSSEDDLQSQLLSLSPTAVFWSSMIWDLC